MTTRRDFLAVSVAGAGAPAPLKGANRVALRTHEWYGDKLEYFEFPAGWKISVQNMKGHGTPPLDGAAIRRAVQAPVGSKRLAEIAAGKKTVAIAFDDISRPTPIHDVVPHVVAELRSAGIRDENILFVAACGAHSLMTNQDTARKLGAEAVRRHPWINHNIWEGLADVGTTKAKNRVFINPYFYRADVKITISGLKHHGTPGYSGGPKLILPGISGEKTIFHMHDIIQRARRPRTDKDGVPIFYMWDNEQRQDMIEAARLAGVDFSVQIAYGEERKCVKVVAGDIVAAHHAGARYAVEYLGTEDARDADVVVVNAYPKGYHAYDHAFSWAGRGLKEGGSIVVINEYPGGMSTWHYMDERRSWMRDPQSTYFSTVEQRKPRFPQAAQVLYYSHYLQARELNLPGLAQVQGVNSWEEVLTRLKRRHKGDVHVAVYPYGGIQHGIARLDLPENV